MPWRIVDSSSSSSDGESNSSDSEVVEALKLTRLQRNYVEIGDMFLRKSGVGPWILKLKRKFTYASDCSGADAPWMALEMLWRGMGLDCDEHLQYMSSSEICKAKRRFLKANFPCQQLADDVLTKDVSHLRNKICAYCCGFPCTPYSFLHTGTSLLQDANCQQLFQIVRNCKRMLPAIILLENVIGFLRVYEKVWKFLQRNLPQYEFAKARLSPHAFGAPLSRERLYMIFVRKDVLCNDAKTADFQQFIFDRLTLMTETPGTRWPDLLMPNTHWAVMRDMDARDAARRNNADKPINPNAKWIKRHRKWAEEKEVDIRESLGLFSRMYPQASRMVTTTREMQALDLICAVKGGVVAANTSQNLGVLPCTFNVEKPLMCLTPAGKFLTTTHSRYLLGRECMLLQGMPVHRLDLTVCSERVMHSLAGNSMHVRCVMACICAAMQATDPALLEAVLD